jgi:soluble lytic murein transglycosylase-like protein
MRLLASRIASAAVAAALIFDSTAGIAATAPPVTTPQASQASWLTLSMLSPSGAIGLAGAAAQPATDVPPPPPPPPEGNAYGGVPLPVIGIWLGGIALAVYIATRNHRSRFNIPTSPF